MNCYNYSKVLGTTELRENIFQFSDNATLARCGRVCSQWTDSALGLLWESMIDIVPLFKVLAPMQIQVIHCLLHTVNDTHHPAFPYRIHGTLIPQATRPIGEGFCGMDV